MFEVLKGASVLLLLSAFFVYVLVPIVDGVRRRWRFGDRNRPLPRTVVIVILYLVMFVPATLVWKSSAEQIRHSVRVSAPAAIDRLFKASNTGRSETLRTYIPASVPFGDALAVGVNGLVGYVEREIRTTFDDLLAASRYVEWLAVVPLAAAFLITTAPGFRRSAERLLPHGHLQWRVGEYMRDVNSALAGYVRAQLAAGLIVGSMCAVGFTLLALPSALAMGIIAGVLETVPAIGPITALLMAMSQADHPVSVAVFLGVAPDRAGLRHLPAAGAPRDAPGHSVVVLAIWFGAVLAGATGVILAIPVAGLVSVSLRHWLDTG